jgi:hypothetical protein
MKEVFAPVPSVSQLLCRNNIVQNLSPEIIAVQNIIGKSYVGWKTNLYFNQTSE